MRFGTIRLGGLTSGAVVADDGQHVHPLGRSLESLFPTSLDELLAAGRQAQEIDPLPLEDVSVLAPIVPASVRDFVTFEEHVKGVRRSVDGASGVPRQWYTGPTFYFGNPHTVVGPDAPVSRPELSQALDFELEVAAVLGWGGSSLTEAQAEEAIIGYTIFNDWSARDLQSAEMTVGLGPAKGKDFATSLGPWLVTVDELEDRRDADGFLTLQCSVAVNGTEIGRDSLAHMGWSFATMTAYASRDSVVRPLDVLASGTTGGGGSLAELWGRTGRREPPPVEPGDVVTLTVEGLGSLSNPVVGGAPTPPISPFRSLSRTH
jgi:2-keto-4-pentenoate hydratase/2-oxohepta-3-ene-1,7-dioic acid hydratase in catechol pathway